MRSGHDSLRPLRWRRPDGAVVIALVRGEIVARANDYVVVDVGGIGYKVCVPCHPAGDLVTLHTHQVVREDAQQLFGFESREWLALFELLITVSGVGPK